MIEIFKYYFKRVFSITRFIIAIVVPLLITFAVYLTYDNLSLNDLILWQFMGQGSNEFSLIQFLIMLIYNGTPIYLLCSFIERDSMERGFHITVRLKQKKKWISVVLHTSILFAVMYVLLSICIIVIFAFISNISFTGYNGFIEVFEAINITPITPWYLYLIVIVAKNLELLFCLLIIILIYCYTNKITIGFIVLQIGYFVSFIPLLILKYLPTGISSLSRIIEVSGEGLTFLTLVAFLLAINFVLYCYIRFIAYKKIFN